MDGVEILYKLKNTGYNPENRKESEFIDLLKGNGFIAYDFTNRVNKLQDGVIIEESVDEINLMLAPKIFSLDLFLPSNNFTPTLEKKIAQPHIRLNGLSTFERIDWTKILGDHLLGEDVDVSIIAYGKNSSNEGFQVELPEKAKSLCYFKGNPVFTTGLSKGAKEKDTQNLEFKPIRRSAVKTKLGVMTNFGAVYDLAELSTVKKVLKINKADFYA